MVKDDKPNLLDVGSCYNPFNRADSIFDVTAIDLSPATAVSSVCPATAGCKIDSPVCDISYFRRPAQFFVAGLSFCGYFDATDAYSPFVDVKLLANIILGLTLIW